jgi:hypothetical protein
VTAPELDGGARGLLVLRDDVAHLFGVELLGERRRADEVAEEDRQLPALALGSTPGLGPRLVDGGPAHLAGAGVSSAPAAAAEVLVRIVLRPARGTDLTEAGPALRAEATVGAVRVAAGGALHRVGSTASVSSGARNGCPAGRDRTSAPVTSNRPGPRSTTLANTS